MANTLPLPIPATDVQIVRVVKALFDAAPGYSYLQAFKAEVAANGMNNFANALTSYVSQDKATLAATVVSSLGLAGAAATNGTAYLMEQFAQNPGNYGVVVLNAMNALSTMESDPNFGMYATHFNNSVAAAWGNSSNPAGAGVTDLNSLQTMDEVPWNIFTLTSETTTAGADIMRLTGDMDARIDLTANTNQVEGLDLNGNGVIAGQPGANNTDIGENNNPTTNADGTQQDTLDYEIIDAYSRDQINEFNITENFRGDIDFDGTGFEGDGISTDGNIFLGGLGADVARAGIGNDFLAGGGVAATGGTDALYGGRNADFFFASLSDLATTDGDSLQISGGQTTDDSAVIGDTAMDSDWLLLEVADDEDGTVVDLDDTGDATGDGDGNSTDLPGGQFVLTGDSGAWVWMTEIENVDASGNLYGFLDGIDVALGEGGSMVDDENVGIGASSQLNIIGSGADNIFIGGYDNDLIQGNAGNDLLFGGNLDYNNNPNMQNIVNDGVDELYGGAGDDNIVFEADGGIYEGDSAQDADGGNNDTLWLTDLALGTQTVDDMTTDDVLRFDLNVGLVGGLDNASGYGGADADPDANGAYTADQSNYADGVNRGAVQDMENVIATGLGDVDYLAAGTNDPELLFNNQQNIQGYEGDLDLRGTAGDNTLYANTGDDYIEGRRGDDNLSGGEGNDTFIFALDGNNGQDGLDVIHRQTDIGNNLTDGTFGQDFGVNSTSEFGPSTLVIDFSAANLADANVHTSSFSVVIGGVTFAVTNTAALQAATTTSDLAIIANSAFQAIDANVSVTSSGNIITIKDSTPTGGRNISDTQAEGYAVSLTVVAPGTGTLVLPVYTAAGEEISQDLIVFASYEDRADGELVDDDGMVNSTGDAVTLGADAYAEDLVVRFDSDGNGTTVLAEDQQWDLDFTNLADEDTVSISVNGTAFTLQMGVAADGTAIGETMAQFLARMVDLINAGSDNDTLAGTLVAATDGIDTISLTQGNYYTGQVAFMDMPVVALGNASGGEPASVAISQPNTDSEITLLDFDGRDASLNADNVLFLGGSGMNDGVVTNADNSRSVLATAAAAGGALAGSNAIVVDSMTDVNTLATDFSLHGDDLLFGGAGDDDITTGTGDDRIFGSAGTDTVDGGKDLYVVQSLVAGSVVETVETLNAYDAAQRLAAADVIAVALLEEDIAAGATDGFVDQLIFSTTDFTGTQFTVTVDDDLQQMDGGAGTVGVDEGDNGTIDHTTIFTEMEAIRTLSGDGTHAGQGNDTLNVEALSNAVAASDVGDVDAAVVYNMTSDLGFVQINADLNGDDAINADLDQNPLNADGADENDSFLAVDGVERLIGGNANETLNIDESEVNKDNYFDGDDEVVTVDVDEVGDSIVYNHLDMNNNTVADDDGVIDTVANGIITSADFTDSVAVSMRPSIEIVVESADETDLVNMTGGTIIGSDTTVDTLVDVETINVTNAAISAYLDDTIDVSNVDGATVDFAGEVRDGAEVLAQIVGMTQLENVLGGDGDDTVLVANSMTNYRAFDSDNGTTSISYASFLDYDTFNVAGDARVAFSNIPAEGAGPVGREDANNQTLFTFDLADGQDRVDYSAETGNIAAVVDLEDAEVAQTVFVMGVDFLLTAADDRIDLLKGVEEVVASQGTSILDFTGSETNLSISYMSEIDATLVAAADRYEYTISIEDLDSSVPFGDFSYIEYMDAGDSATVTAPTALWNRIEGSDNNEKIELTDDQSASAHIFNLRGGANEVNYNELTRGIIFSVNSVDNGITSATVQALDTAGVAIAGGVDTITSYNENNDVTVGSLRVEASQSEEDVIDMSGLVNNNLFLLGTKEGLADVVEVHLDTTGSNVGITLTGFESLLDSQGNDIYQIEDLSDFFDTLFLTDNVAIDSDTLKLTDDALESDFGVTWDDDSIEMDDFEDSADGANDAVQGFDFDTLDISALTEQTDTVITLDADETLVLGDLGEFGDQADAFVDVRGFAKIQFTTTDGMGANVVIDMDNGEFREDDGTILFTFDSANVFDFSAITDNMTVTVVDTLAVGVTVITDATDSITGSDGDDILVGGAGADTLDGGIIPQVNPTLTFTLSAGVMGSTDADDTLVITNATSAATITISEDGTVISSLSGDITPTTGGIAGNASTSSIADVINAISLADWNAGLGLFNGEGAGGAISAITSVTVNKAAGAAEIVFEFDGADEDLVPADLTLAIVDATADSEITIDVNGVAAVAAGVAAQNAGNGDDYAAEQNSADNYLYYSTSESTAAAMDTIENFDGTDLIWLDSSIISAAGVVQDKGDALDFTDLGTGVGFFNDTIAVGTDGSNGMIFIDADGDGDLTAADMQIKIDGATNADDFDNAADYVVGTFGTPFADALNGVDGDTDGDGVADVGEAAVADTIYSFAGNDQIDITENAILDATDTIVFAATAALNGADNIVGFDTTVDDLNLTAFETAGALVSVVGALTTTAGTIYTLGGLAAGSADSATAAAAALTAAAVWTGANATAWCVVVDNNSTAIYEFNDTAAPANEVTAGELTLVGVIDAVVVAGDIVI